MPKDDLTRVIKKDLSKPRENRQIDAYGNGWNVEKIDGPASIRVASKQAYPYPLREFERQQLPQSYSEFYLSNPGTSGELILHILKEDGMQPLASSGKGGLPIKTRVERNLDLTEKHQIVLDTSSFGRPYLELTAITYDSDGNYPGSSVEWALYASPDKVRWYESQTFTGDIWQNGWTNAWRYVRLENTTTGSAGETCDMILTTTE